MRTPCWKYLQITIKCIAALCMVAVLLFFSPIGFLYLTFGREEIAIKRAIDNPYVNSRYKGWDTASSERYGDFQLPEDWSFVEESDCFRIFDSEGDLWAVGTTYGTASDAYPDRKSFVENVLECNVSSLEYISDAYVNMRYTSGVHSLTVHTENEKVFRYLDLNKDPDINNFVFILDYFDAASAEYDVAEAIVYSYAYD